MEDKLGNSMLVQRFSRFRKSIKSVSVAGKERGFEIDKTTKQPSTERVDIEREINTLDKGRLFRQKLYTSFRVRKEETNKTKILESELIDQKKELAEQKSELTVLKKQVENLLIANEEMAGRLSILERGVDSSENYMVMSLEGSKVKETIKKRPAPPVPLHPEAPEMAKNTSEVVSVEANRDCLSPSALTRPLISKPVLQNTTPNAASQIAKAPSTGVPQSSILASKKEKESDPLKPLRRAVFSDQIIQPSPTSPSKPPIIHQPQGRDPEKKHQRKSCFGKHRSSSLRCRPSNPPPKPPEPLLNNDVASTANKTMQPGEVINPSDGLSSAEKCLADQKKVLANNLEPIYDTISEEVEYHHNQDLEIRIEQNKQEEQVNHQNKVDLKDHHQKEGDQVDQDDQVDQGDQGNQDDQGDQKDQDDQEEGDQDGQEDQLDRGDKEDQRDRKLQEDRDNQTYLKEEKENEDKEEDMLIRSSDGLLEMVQSELLAESIYSTNKLR